MTAEVTASGAQHAAADKQLARAGTSRVQMSLFDADRFDGHSVLDIEEHVGGLGQTAMFASELALGKDDAELRRGDAERHTAQVTEAVEHLARKFGPLSRDEQHYLSGLGARSDRSAARFELVEHMEQALLRRRAFDPA